MAAIKPSTERDLGDPKTGACPSFHPGIRRDSIERLTDAALQPASLGCHFRAENRGKRTRTSTASLDGDRRTNTAVHLQTEIIGDEPVVFPVPFSSRRFRCFSFFCAVLEGPVVADVEWWVKGAKMTDVQTNGTSLPEKISGENAPTNTGWCFAYLLQSQL